MVNQKYVPLRQNSRDVSKEGQLEDDTCECRYQKSSGRREWYMRYSLAVVLILSLTSNLALFHRVNGRSNEDCNTGTYFGMPRNKIGIIPHDDRGMDDPMWDAPEFDWNVGWVALNSQEVKNKNIPSAMHWPWDESKSIYVLHGFHSLHCVFVLRDSLLQFRDGKPQLWPFSHVTHCLHALREDTICNADDTPRYTGRLHAQANSTLIFSGVGQARQCRDWEQLRKHAIESSACYQRPTDKYVPLLDRYQHCPDGSEPWKDIEG